LGVYLNVKSNPFITIIEHKLLSYAAMIAFIFSVASLVSQFIGAYNDGVQIEQSRLAHQANSEMFFEPFYFYGGYPQYLIFLILLLGLNYLFIINARRFLFASLTTFFSFLFFVKWFIYTREGLSEMEGVSHIKGLESFFFQAGNFDLIVLLLVSILLFWQISILLRMLIKTVQRKYVLP
jgi:hypothetical protein